MSNAESAVMAARETFKRLTYQHELLSIGCLEAYLEAYHPNHSVGGSSSVCTLCELPDRGDYGIALIEHPESVASTLRAFATTSNWYGVCNECNYSRYMCDVLNNYDTHDYTIPCYEDACMQAVQAIADYMHSSGIYVGLGLGHLFWLCDLPSTFDDVRSVFMDWDNRPELELGSNFDMYLEHTLESRGLGLDDLLSLGEDNE